MYGRCNRCNGSIQKEWGGIAPQYYCTKCGALLNSPGHKRHVGEKEILRELELVWETLGSETLNMMALFETVRSRLAVSRLQISISTLIENGYEINNGYIRRRKQV